MTTSLNISRPLVDSFVHRKIKLLKTRGSGEAKFHIGSAENSGDFDSFFNNYTDENTYYFKKNNLLEFLLKEKFEFYCQFINQYKEVSPEYWDSVYEEVLALSEEITFKLMPFNDGKRYYIRSESGDIFNDLVRRIALPLISILTIQKESADKFLFTLDVDFTNSSKSVEEDTLIAGKGYNKIIYGAPGSGKSASVSEIVGENYIRTVFHPETQYSDFIGCLKPHKDSSGSITYSFRKGPFIQILEKALLDKENHYFLVIEELNRANTAAVFGEIFQLLDRDDEGKSEYPILIQDEDLYDALAVTLGSSHEFIVKRQLMIPSNLSIIATMNSSDQAVFPLDTAFKRRWIFKYLPIDFTNCARGEVPIHHAVLPNVEWKTLAQTINTVLVQLNVVEDKLIGPWFIKNSDLIEGQAEQTFIGKICSYLWDDALKYKNHNDKIFKREILSYGQLHQIYSEGAPIFSDSFIELLQAPKDANEGDSTEPES